jgi:hypothetical protein
LSAQRLAERKDVTTIAKKEKRKRIKTRHAYMYYVCGTVPPTAARPGGEIARVLLTLFSGPGHCSGAGGKGEPKEMEREGEGRSQSLFVRTLERSMALAVETVCTHGADRRNDDGEWMKGVVVV